MTPHRGELSAIIAPRASPHLKFRDIEAEYQRLPDSLLVHPSFILYVRLSMYPVLLTNTQYMTVKGNKSKR